MKNVFLLLLLSGSVPAAAQNSFALHQDKHTAFNPPVYKTHHFNYKPQMIKEIQPNPATGSSRAVVVDDVPLAHTTQFLPLNKKGELVGKGNTSKQVKQLFENIETALKKAGSGTDQIVKINVYIRRAEIMAEVQKQLSKILTKVRPAVSYTAGDLAHPDADVAMDVVAVSVSAGSSKVNHLNDNKLYGNAASTHVSILPAGGVTYVSGQADKGNLAAATSGTLKQLDGTLKYLNIAKDQVVQIKAFMRPMSDISIVEKQFASFFNGKTPPVVYVNWVSENPVIEIELIAASSEAGSKASDQLSYLTPPGMTASPVYSKVSQINHGKRIYISSLYGSTLNDSKMQTKEIFASMKELLAAAGSDFQHLAKATYYVSDDLASTSLNEIRPGFYDPKRAPAASKAMVKGVGVNGMGINIDMIGVVR